MMELKKHIYLTGFMGAGKSKTGPLIAARLNIPFFDCDDHIVATTGMSIRDIFEKKGEPVFRNLESEMLKSLGNNTEPSLIALGGGALNKEENRQFINQTGINVFIKSSPEAIFQRIKHSRKRPLLDVPEGPDREKIILTKIQNLLNQRDPIYHTAEIVFDRDKWTLDEIIDQLEQRIRQIWKRS